ncbi:MAG TPA: MATE family efflux transporter [Kiritimatiellia bacterium]|nr:MATE family efflux transporter [Kiritimatiellia bacterium]HMO99437.1 MATE family efflux transporter [Kiritimatiellia bacterium]HMP97384.1 MATE family efflux transporter [Kiritimatiellia bacterium]
MSSESSLLTEPVPRLVLRLAIPASVGYFFNTLYNLIDTWFAGSLSTEALAALGMSFPVFFVVIAVASGLSTGVSALLANALGAGRHEEARTLGTQAITFTLLASAVVTCGGALGAGPVFRALGAAPEVAHLATRYMVIIFSGSVFFNVNHVMNACLVARGDTTTYRNVLIAGVGLNAILDPWFIYGGFGLPALGFDGIALSTVMIQAAACGYLYRCARRRQAVAAFAPGNLRLSAEAAGAIFRQSGPAMINMMTIGLGILILTYFVNEHGTAAVAAYGLATRIEQLVLLPAIGLNLAVLAIVGQNNGAGRPDRIRETMRAALRYGLYVLIPGFLLLVVWPDKSLALFTDDPDVQAIGVQYLRMAGFVLYAYVILFALTAALQAIKQPMYAVWIGLYRQIVAPVAIIYGLSRFAGLGIWSVWISIAFTTWSAALFTLWYAGKRLRSTAHPS